MNYKVSIIMPVYNREFLAIRSVKSVMNQTYKNWELLIINDGSSEKINMLREMVKSDVRIKIYDIDHNGVSVARNKGIEEATGEYIAFLDSDDLFKPTKIEEELKYMIDNNFTFCHTAYDRIDYNGNYTETMYSGKLSGYVFEKLLHGCPVATPTVMIKKDVINDSRFVPGYTVSQDICFWIDISYSQDLGYIEKPLSQVTFGEKSTAVTEVRILQGQKNIVAHVLGMPKYNLYRKYLARREKIIEEKEKVAINEAQKNKIEENKPAANIKKSIVIDIPFNIDLSEYLKGSTYIYPKVKESFQKAQKEDWIRRRLSLFMKYAAKSLTNQTSQNFIAVVRCTETTLDKINQILKEYDKLPENIIFTHKAQEIIDKQMEAVDKLYRVVIDSDNMYSDKFIEVIEYMSLADDTKTLICQTGYIYDEKTDRIAELNHKSPSFYAAIYDKETYKTLYPLRLFENHWRAIDYAYEVVEGRQFCICVHEQNVDNDFEKIVKAFNGIYLEGDNKDKILKEWHIR